MTVKTIDKQAAQGELLITRIAALPAGLRPAQPTAQHIIGHSETGHHHVIDAAPHVEVFESPEDAMTLYLRVIEATEATEVLLRHLRGHDTHESIRFTPGVYQITRQREAADEDEWQRAAD